MLIGAAIFAAGLLVGIGLTFGGAWVYERVMWPDPPPTPPVKPEGPPKARCACEHIRSAHIGGKGKCQDLRGPSYDHKPCPCQIYDGPEPLLMVHVDER